MSEPRTLAEALAQCRASGVDLRVSGRGMSACMDLMFPFCPAGVSSAGPDGLPSCVVPPSARKVAILAAEAEARAAAARAALEPSPWPIAAAGGLVVVSLAALLLSR